MVFVIGDPVGVARERKWRLVARLLLFGVAAVAGGALLAASLGAVGRALVPESVWLWLLVFLVVGFAVVRETYARWLPIPQRRWQLPRRWLTRFWFGSFIFGGAMGMGIFTITPSAIFYVYLLACLLSGSVAASGLLGAWYGAWFFAGVVVGTIAWRGLSAEDKGSRARKMLSRARIVGAAAAPALLLLPGAWPFVSSL